MPLEPADWREHLRIERLHAIVHHERDLALSATETGARGVQTINTAFSARQKRPTSALSNQTRPGSRTAIAINFVRDAGRSPESTKPPIAVLAIEGLVIAAGVRVVSRWHPEAWGRRSSRCGTGGAAC